MYQWGNIKVLPAMLLLPYPPNTLTPVQQRQALIYLLQRLAYREGDFTLSSGQKSSYYINCKPVTLHPQGAYLVGVLIQAALPAHTNAVAGLTLGADPVVTAVAMASVMASQGAQNLAALIVRKTIKAHGTQAALEGPLLPPGSRVWVLEDVVTTGTSALQAVEQVRAADYSVEGVLTLVDRQQGGTEYFSALDLPFKAIFSIQDLQTPVQLPL